MDDEPFQLRNDPPPYRPWKPEPAEKETQHLLFEGMDCLSGQQDLFDDPNSTLRSIS